MRVSHAIAVLLCLPRCFASDSQAQCGATAPAAAPQIPLESQVVLREQRAVFEALFPKSRWDEKAFPYLLGAPVYGRGFFAGVTNAGPFTLKVTEAFPIVIQSLPLSASLKEGASLHGVQLTGVVATLVTPGASVEVYGMVATQTSVAGSTKFLLGGMLSSIKPRLPGPDPSLCSCSREGYPCSDFGRGFDPWLCDSQEFDNYQASMVSACVTFQRVVWDAEQRYRHHVSASMDAFAKSALEAAGSSWQGWLADGAPARSGLLSASAALRAHLTGCEMAKASTLEKAAGVLRATQESVKRDFLDKIELARKN